MATNLNFVLIYGTLAFICWSAVFDAKDSQAEEVRRGIVGLLGFVLSLFFLWFALIEIGSYASMQLKIVPSSDSSTTEQPSYKRPAADNGVTSV